ncbi:MAG: hypothetical protein QM597_07190 [Aeromicrobium sp.]|uniref:hypothetical protein n=1 Tax=Aeromicrobium sp. TaxID=1871063 RepID=UPI0039E53CB0
MNERTQENTHPFNAWSFLAGTVFVLVAAGWASVESGLFGTGTLLVAAPITLIALGIGGLALTFVRRNPPAD